MKRAVDLTLKRDFYIKGSTSLENLITFRIFGTSTKLPWKINRDVRQIRDDRDLVTDSDVSKEEIIITGNKSKRKETKKYRYLSRNICDCCGLDFGRIAWQHEYGLCKECSKDFPNREKIPWRNNSYYKRIAWR